MLVVAGPVRGLQKQGILVFPLVLPLKSHLSNQHSRALIQKRKAGFLCFSFPFYQHKDKLLHKVMMKRSSKEIQGTSTEDIECSPVLQSPTGYLWIAHKHQHKPSPLPFPQYTLMQTGCLVVFVDYSIIHLFQPHT